VARLTLSFLGTFQVRLEEEPAPSFVSDKARALLAYLATEADRPHRRETVASLFWPDASQGAAFNSLRQALFSIRRAIRDQDASPPFLLISRQSLQFNPASDHWLDVTAFTACIVASKAQIQQRLATREHCIQHLERAATLYRGDFLGGLTLKDSSDFEEWSLLKRELMHEQALQALRYLADYYEQQGDHQRARFHTRHQIELDPWQEEAHRQMMRLLVLGGQRAAALAQYETCRRILAESLGVEPTRDTRELYERIRAGQ
jgi:DNA-binding SARP family transcriptional activator